ncbi:MAG: phospholipid methyltransferase [Alphaproteobacteria bacterium]|nr:phospholipid methyltransferase [Alphaproteobacteria bacterium]
MLSKPKHFFTPARNTLQQRPMFLAAWLRAPLKIGAVTPSSKGLARAMARQIDLHKEGMVIELGAGTGPVTRALLEAHVPPERLLVIEREPKLLAVLHAEFPTLNILRADVIDLADLLAERGITEVCAVVSSLPLLSMPNGIRTKIEGAMAAAISKGGVLIQFTYAPRSPIPQNRWRSLRIYGKRKKFIISNLPPAHVWVYKRDRRIKPRK